MTKFPELYLHESIEEYASSKDYDKLITFIKHIYHEIFNVKELEKRLRLYSLEYDMKIFRQFPLEKGLIKRIEQDIDGKRFLIL